MDSNITAPLMEAWARKTGSAPTAKSGAFVGASIHTPASVPPTLRQAATSTALEDAARKATPFVRTETTASDGSYRASASL